VSKYRQKGGHGDGEMTARNLTHSNVWRAIELLAAKHGMSVSGLARRARLDLTAFNKSKRVSTEGKPRWPTTETIAKILEATGEPLADFISLTGRPGKSRSRKDRGRVRG
jgi:phage repressor protein C with HTH and peptisase S24 domain